MTVTRTNNMYFTDEVLYQILTEIGGKEAEQGGILLGPKGTDVVTMFGFDERGSTSAVTYSPDVDTINELMELCYNMDLELKGFVHSHPGLETPSYGDVRYAQNIFAANPGLKELYLPILPYVPIDPEEDFELEDRIKPWMMNRFRDSAYLANLVIVDENFQSIPEDTFEEYAQQEIQQQTFLEAEQEEGPDFVQEIEEFFNKASGEPMGEYVYVAWYNSKTGDWRTIEAFPFEGKRGFQRAVKKAKRHAEELKKGGFIRIHPFDMLAIVK